MRRASKTLIITSLGLAALCAIVATSTQARQGPAWLDDGISEWNKANPKSQIQFNAMKDSYAWYTMPVTQELSSKDVRGKIYGIAGKNGYAHTQDEEMVTTGRPPVKSGMSSSKKCWTRSFMRDAKWGSDASTTRMLTTMVCEDPPNWSIGFRTLQ